MIERQYTINLRKGTMTASRGRRAKKAMFVLRAFLEKHMKSDNVKVSEQLNRTAVLISKGKKLPSKLKDSMSKVLKDKFDFTGFIPQPAYAMAAGDRGSPAHDEAAGRRADR